MQRHQLQLAESLLLCMLMCRRIVKVPDPFRVRDDDVSKSHPSYEEPFCAQRCALPMFRNGSKLCRRPGARLGWLPGARLGWLPGSCLRAIMFPISNVRIKVRSCPRRCGYERLIRERTKERHVPPNCGARFDHSARSAPQGSVAGVAEPGSRPGATPGAVADP